MAPRDPQIFLFTAINLSAPSFQLLEFLPIRGTAAGPLFCWPDNTPVHRAYFTRVLKDALRFPDLDLKRYKTHSFRIGVAFGPQQKACLTPKSGFLVDGNRTPFRGISACHVSALPLRRESRSPTAHLVDFFSPISKLIHFE